MTFSEVECSILHVVPLGGHFSLTTETAKQLRNGLRATLQCRRQSASHMAHSSPMSCCCLCIALLLPVSCCCLTIAIYPKTKITGQVWGALQGPNSVQVAPRHKTHAMPSIGSVAGLLCRLPWHPQRLRPLMLLQSWLALTAWTATRWTTRRLLTVSPCQQSARTWGWWDNGLEWAQATGGGVLGPPVSVLQGDTLPVPYLTNTECSRVVIFFHCCGSSVSSVTQGFFPCLQGWGLLRFTGPSLD